MKCDARDYSRQMRFLLVAVELTPGEGNRQALPLKKNWEAGPWWRVWGVMSAVWGTAMPAPGDRGEKPKIRLDSGSPCLSFSWC